MSLAVVNAGLASASVGTNLLGDINLTSAQSAQIEQILSELQTGVISPVEARAQIAGIVGHAQLPTSSGSTPPVQNTEPLQSYYPLPQESLKGALASYNSVGAATETLFTTFNTVNSHA